MLDALTDPDDQPIQEVQPITYCGERHSRGRRAPQCEEIIPVFAKMNNVAMG